MFNRSNRNDVDDDVQDIHNDVRKLADSLESVLKSWGSDAKGEADDARRKAKSLLRETRARLQGRSTGKHLYRCAAGSAQIIPDSVLSSSPPCPLVWGFFFFKPCARPLPLNASPAVKSRIFSHILYG